MSTPRRGRSLAFLAVTLSVAGCKGSPQASPAGGQAAQAAATPEPPRRVPGPVSGTRLTEGYARMIARDTYFWAWPMVNIYNRRLAFAQVPEPGLAGGLLPVAPLNRLAMLSDYVEPSERDVACPNQDVVYGAGIVALDQGPVVIQVPDFGSRFWVYQVVDIRTDSFADLGAMYGTRPGFYLLAGPGWKGETPAGVAKVFHSRTNTAFVVPRVFQSDAPEDKQAVQALIAGIDMYPLSEFNGQAKTRDWSKIPRFPKPAGGAAETRWVFPERFFDQLPAVLRDAPPLDGEEARYAEVVSMIEAALDTPNLKRAIVEEAARAERDLVEPLLQFRNFGLPLAGNWTTINNGAAFGTDYFTRTAVAKSNILVNKAGETKYFYQDLDAAGARLNGGRRYTVTFPSGGLPPVKGFWSLTLYNRNHFFVPNPIRRYSVGTKNKDLQPAADGSLTVYVQADEPADPAQRANWLPAPRGEDFSLYVRAYWPEAAITSGQWTPPGVTPAR